MRRPTRNRPLVWAAILCGYLFFESNTLDPVYENVVGCLKLGSGHGYDDFFSQSLQTFCERNISPW